MFATTFPLALFATFAITAPDEAPPIFLIVWLSMALVLAVRSVRVVVSARSLRLGSYEWGLEELRKVHFELPGWSQQRGQRAVVVVETVLGRKTWVKVPNAVEPLIRALMIAGVPMSRSTLGSWCS